MRQRCANSEQPRVAQRGWHALTVALAIWLVLVSLPIGSGQVSAAPPDGDGARQEPVAAEAAPEQEGAPDAESDDPAEVQRLTSRDAIARASVRPRGLEAPMQLRQEAGEASPSADEPPDPGDGEPSSSRGGTAKTAERQPRESKPSRGIRVWPMRADSYSFSQAFGCVPQIAHFYQPGEGCPPEAPVIHHGIDMAAPEGTPFYAAASGWVTESGHDREVGVANTRIIIQHEGRNDGYATEYLHWIASFVEVGDYVEAGEFIGEVGSVGYSTGPHLHFSVIDLDSGGNLDPVAWLPDEPEYEGYRGRQPRERAVMRLPAGTTAGVPEYADPAPPAPPARYDLRAAGVDHQGRDREDRQRKRDRKERKDQKEGKKSSGAARAESSPDSDESVAPAGNADNGKKTERTRTRERDKDGRSTTRSERGDDASGSKRKSSEKRADKADKRSGEEPSDAANAPESGKKSGKKHDNRSVSNGHAVDQRETPSGKKDRKKKS